MKILEIIPTLSSGGGERFVVDLANELSRENDITLLVFRLDGNLSFYLPQVSENVRVVLIKKHSGLDLRLFFRVWRFIRTESPDIIHTHLKGLLYSFFAELFLVRGVHTVHSEPDMEAPDIVSRCVRRILFGLRRVIPVGISLESSASFERFYHIKPVTIANGRNVPQNLITSNSVKQEILSYKKNENTRVIVHLASITEVKRQTMMARVAGRLYKDDYNFVILFIGRDDDQNLVNEVRREMPPCCHILGLRQNPLEYLREAGAYGLCSSCEGLPISLIEALGVGAVPICTPVGGIVNVVHDGENGILSEDADEESYYLAMKRYLDMSDVQIREMSSKAIKSYAPYSMTECAEHYYDLFKGIISGKK